MYMFFLTSTLLNICYRNQFYIVESVNGHWPLTEYSLTYMHLKAVKGQVVADFIVNHSIVENSLNYLVLAP